MIKQTCIPGENIAISNNCVIENNYTKVFWFTLH